MKIITLRTTGDCPDVDTCPSEHVVDDDPGNLYLVSKDATDAERAVFAGVVLSGEIVGWMPAGFLPVRHPALGRTRDAVGPALREDRQYVITTEVTDAIVLAGFARLIADDECLGTVPATAGMIDA